MFDIANLSQGNTSIMNQSQNYALIGGKMLKEPSGIY